MSHDASATWSGFNYQGKVALYHVLKMVCDKLATDTNFDFSEYKLVLENHEDFDIKGPSGFVSFHQVKAINDTAFSTYENALFAMMMQLDTPDNVSVTGYLHTWKKINWTGSSSFEDKLKGILKKVIDNHTESPSDSFISKGFTNDNVTEKKIKIIRQAKLEDSRLRDASSTYGVINQAYSSSQPDRVISRVKLYQYDSVYSCNIDEIDLLVRNKIKVILDSCNIEIDDNGLEKIFCSLLALIDDNVINKHLNLTNNDESPINFNDIIDIVRNEKIRDSDLAYMTSKFKMHFVKAFEEFLSDEELCSIIDSNLYSNRESNLNEVMKFLLDIRASELWEYFKKFNPHICWNDTKSIDMAFQTNIDDLRQYLFNIFNKICKEKLIYNNDKKSIIYKKGTNKYLPTTIGLLTKKKIVLDVMNNSHAISSLYEINALVSGCNFVEEIVSFDNEYNRLSSVTLDEFYTSETPDVREKINEIGKNIRIIKTDTAMDEINNA